MSTTYDYIGPIDLKAILPRLKSQFEIETNNSKEGSECLTDGTSYLHVYPFEWEGKQHLSAERFGLNDVYFILSAISELTDVNFVDEHDEDYDKLPWNELIIYMNGIDGKREWAAVVPVESEDKGNYIFHEFDDLDDLINAAKTNPDEGHWLIKGEGTMEHVYWVDGPMGEVPDEDGHYMMPPDSFRFYGSPEEYENDEA